MLDTTHAVAMPDLVSEVLAAVERLKVFDKLASVLVWCPNAEAARALSRATARRAPMFDVTFLTGQKLANLVSSGDDPRPALTPRVARELVRKVARASNSTQLSRLDSPVMVDQLSQAFRELRQASRVELEGHFDNGQLARELIEMFALYRNEASAYRDTTDALEYAADSLERDGPSVVAVGIRPDHPGEVALANALERAGRLERVEVRVTADVVSSPVEKTVVVVPDPGIEAHVMVESVLENARNGVHFGDMAVLHGGVSAHVSELELALDAAGVPWRARRRRSGASDIAVSFAKSLVKFARSRGGADELISLMRAAPLRISMDGDEQAPVTRWLHAIRKAKSSGSVTQLTHRLRAADELQAADFIEEMSQLTATNHRRWTQWCEWIRTLLVRYLDGGDDAFDLMERCLVALESLDHFGCNVDAASFDAALGAEIESQSKARHGKAAVLLASWSDVDLALFDCVFVMGLSSTTSAGTSPVLAAIRPPGAEPQRDRDRAAVLHAIGGATHAEIYLSRADPRAGREAIPSPLAIEIASVWAGRGVGVDELFGDTSESWLRVVPSFASAVTNSTMPSSNRLERLNLLTRKGRAALGDVGVSASSIDAVTGRMSASLTKYDGSASGAELPEILSPTRLEKYANCPRHYFFETALGVAGTDDIEDEWELAPLEKGKLIHEIMERFVKRFAHDLTPEGKWNDAARVGLRGITTEAMTTARDRGVAPGGLIWESQLETLHRQLSRVLDVDEDLRAELHTKPSVRGAEVNFGNDETAVEVETSVAPVRFRGRIDRVDRSDDSSHLVAIDYKTGRRQYKTGIAKDVVDHGTQLQPTIYAAHLAADAPPDAQIASYLWFVTDDHSAQKPFLKIVWDEAARERLNFIVDAMARGITSGSFPAVPGDDRGNGDYANCRVCPYDMICPADRADAWARKSSDPKAAPFVEVSSDVPAD